MARTFFTDRDLGRQFPSVLRDAGISVERHSDHFPDNMPDEAWIAAVAGRGWIAVSHDKAISRRPNERAAVFAAGLGLLIVVGKATHRDLAMNFVATYPRIARFIERYEPPFIARIYRPAPADVARRPKAIGRVELWKR